jgi:GntR family transcriptional regulator
MAVQPRSAKSHEEKSYLYQDVARTLRERIVSGTYRQNTKLPTLHDLISEFGVSTISVRRALKELANEGLIYGEQGRGIFVKSKGVIHRVLPVDSNSSTGDEIARAGFQPRIQELKRDKVAADEETANRLNLKPGTRIRRHQKLIYADAEPVSFHILYYPEHIAERLAPNLDKMFVFRLLHFAKLKVNKTRFEFGAAALSSDHVEIFDLPIGFPMGVVFFTPLTKAGQPILTGTTIYRSDRFLYEITAPMVTGNPNGK